MRSVPVGMFHHVNHNADDFITVSVKHFADQMACLVKEGVTTLSAQELLEHQLGQKEAPAKSFAITFDDAWLDVYVHAFPILKQHGLKFTIFVVTDWSEAASKNPPATLPFDFPTHHESEKLVRANRTGEVICGWDHLREMMASGLCSIESHTATHEDVTKMSGDSLRADLRRASQSLQANLGVTSRQLCWPKGRHNKQSTTLAQEEGIEATYLVKRGVNLAGKGGLDIKRFTVDDRPGSWLLKQIGIFSRPVYGYLYSRIKPDRLQEKLLKRLSGKPKK
ncbi:MAG: polysaccharide deacetylase family protein [Verrucomicrobiota bacterium]